MNLPQGIDPFLQENAIEFLNFMEASISKSELEVPSFSMVYNPIKGWMTHSQNLVEMDRNPSHHSEILAMNTALDKFGGKYLTNCILYTNLEPCFLCGVSIVKFRIQKVVYFVKAAPGQGISSFPIDMIYQAYHFPELIYIPRNELRDGFRDFFKKKR